MCIWNGLEFLLSLEDNHKPSTLGFRYDALFAMNAEQTFHRKLQTLETNLSTAQSHLSKDAIRLALISLATHYCESGRITDGLPKWLRCKDYCISTRQATEICWEIVVWALQAKNYTLAKDNVTRLERSSDTTTISSISSNTSSPTAGGGSSEEIMHDPQAIFVSKLQITKGLLALVEGDFPSAAKSFLGISGELPANHWSHVISLEDLALYGGLLGLTSLPRGELDRLVTDVVQERLELVPSLRDAIRFYKRADYGKCLNLVQGLREIVDLDIYLAPHADALFRLVREKCICQYFSPYTRVSLDAMRDSFGFATTKELEEVLVELIESNRIVGARIHVRNGTLSVSSGVERRKRRFMIRNIDKLGDGLVKEIEGLVLRQSCIEHGVEVKGERKAGYKPTKKAWGPTGSNWMEGGVSSDEDDTPMMTDMFT